MSTLNTTNVFAALEVKKSNKKKNEKVKKPEKDLTESRAFSGLSNITWADDNSDDDFDEGLVAPDWVKVRAFG